MLHRTIALRCAAAIAAIAFALPAAALAIPFLFVSKWGKQHLGEFLLGFGLLFLGLAILKDSVPDIKSNPEVLEFLKHYTGLGFLSFLIEAIAFSNREISVFLLSRSRTQEISPFFL